MDRNYPGVQSIDSVIWTDPPLLTRDKTVFNQNKDLVYSRFLYLDTGSIDSLLQQAIVVIGELERVYKSK